MNKILSIDGCINDNTIISTNEYLYWLSDNGYVRFNGSFTELISKPAIDTPLKAAISIDPNLIQCAIQDNIIRLSIADVNNNFDSYQVYYYHVISEVWTGYRSNMPVKFWIHYNNNFDNKELYYASRHDNYFIQVDIGNTDIDDDYSLPITIATSIVTKKHNFGNPLMTKTFRAVYLATRGKGYSLNEKTTVEDENQARLFDSEFKFQNIGINEELQEPLSDISAFGEVLTPTIYPSGYYRKSIFPVTYEYHQGTNITVTLNESASGSNYLFYGYEIVWIPKTIRRNYEFINTEGEA